jgi:ubiquinone/menaquinone biosynthesis C-methylase UbiE
MNETKSAGYDNTESRLIYKLKTGRLSADERCIYIKWLKEGYYYDFSSQTKHTDFIVSRRNIKGLKFLEVGFGDGVVLAALAVKGAKCYGVDISKGRFLRAQLLFKMLDLKLNTKLCTMTEMDYKNDLFDVVIAISALEHVDQKNIQPEVYEAPYNYEKSMVEQAVKEICRVLKPGGNAFVHIPNGKSILQVINETHHQLPLLPLLPRFMADWYVTKLAKKDTHYRVGSYLSYKQVVSMFYVNGLSLEEVIVTPSQEEVIEKLKDYCRLKTLC